MSKFFLLFAVILVISFASCKQPGTDLETSANFIDEAYHNLDEVLNKKKLQLKEYLNLARNSAESIRDDQLMRNFFITFQEYDRMKQEVPANVVESIEELKYTIQKHYLNKYLEFNDILFVNPEGTVFYSIRKQEKNEYNIFQSQQGDSGLSQKMCINPEESFVDFQFCDITCTPSGFFIEPVITDGINKGWFVFQFSVDKINNLFSFDEQIGASGEILLVNEDHYMLTDSRFTAESTILRQKLAKENISSKFNEGKGHKAVIDYRGFRVLSSFEVFPFLESKWLLIAKINESEIITNHFIKNQHELQTAYNEVISATRANYYAYRKIDHEVIEVEIDQFRRANPDEVLFTQGVMTCTAILVNYPDHFSYLAHVSPLDKIYGGDRSDLLGQMLKQIQYLEITQSEKQHLEFVVVSPHQNSITNVVDRLVSQGYFLSQIKFLHNPKASYANLSSFPEAAETLVSWKVDDSHQRFLMQKVSEVSSIGSKLRKRLGVI